MIRVDSRTLSLSLLLLILPSVALGNNRCTTEDLPQGAKELVEHDFPNWTIVTLRDLRPDDQKAWLRDYPGECPGIVAGNYEPAERLSYAITLLRRERRKLYQVLLVLSPVKDGYQLRVLSKPYENTGAMIVSKLPPGTYSNSDRSARIRAKFSVISYEAFGVGSIVYYWANGRYHSIQTSE